MPGTHYVEKNLLESYDCKIMCYDCQVCSHAYTCIYTCLDTCLHIYYYMQTYTSST